ncbi:MAG: Glu-tRNA(Gln) amidotransferase subunit GatE [Thaumarchaeota archaeon]|nr:Glu-tRNA(Gln) amidotransferase subunit GatE [Nitrososphaerota archaeon]
MSAQGTPSLGDLGVMVGLEIHQQLATGKKLFCDCPPAEPDAYPITFSRRLRSSSGEVGGHDPAALFEGARAKTITYYADYNSSCLVEQDEEPPHRLDPGAKRTALTIASALRSRTYTELHTMRKTVVDGSNTTGFQRTMLVSEGGSFDVPTPPPSQGLEGGAPGTTRIGVQSICLEEDAARILEAGAHADVDAKGYGLERLGVPLVEIATEPFEVPDPGAVRAAALSLGRMLRGTRMVTRGLGSIRQDVNVSIRGGGGSVVEVKGVQQLDQLADVVSYEAYRQHGLTSISARLRECRWEHDASRDRADVTGVFRQSASSKIIQKAIKQNHIIMAVAFRNAAGIFGYSPHEDVRLGREIAELVRRFGVGGIFHSDELPAYGITERDVAGVAGLLQASLDTDAFIMLAAPAGRTGPITDQIISRVRRIATDGVPADTRLATADGRTAFLRPRPGSARMYPETDVPTIAITQEELDRAAADVPKPWSEAVSDLQDAYGINRQLAEQLWDSPYLELFEEVASGRGSRAGAGAAVEPTFVASALCSSITRLGRQEGMDAGRLDDQMIREAFEMLGKNEIAKESVEMIFQAIMSARAGTVSDAIKSASIQSVGADELGEIVGGIIQDNMEMISNQGERAAGPLMGIAMKRLRGRAPGQKVNEAVVRGIARALLKRQQSRQDRA